MSSQMENNQLISQSSLPQSESSGAENSRIDSENQETHDINDDDCVIRKKRTKTSVVWNDFDEIDLPKVGKKAVCKYCKDKFATGGKGASTSHLRRHTQSCLQRKLHMNASMKQPIQMQMKLKFDKYWGECNLLMAIASVLDPRCKFHVVNICFPLIYTPSVCKEHIDKVMRTLEVLYNEYVEMHKESTPVNTSSDGDSGGSCSFTQDRNSSLVTGFDHIMSIVRETQAVPPSKSELQTYLDESIYIPESNLSTFCAMEWWRNNSFKYKILSKMAADVLAIPISTVASESTFSVGGRVIDDYRSSLNEESIEALICGGDWLRNKYGLKRKKEFEQE